MKTVSTIHNWVILLQFFNKVLKKRWQKKAKNTGKMIFPDLKVPKEEGISEHWFQAFHS